MRPPYWTTVFVAIFFLIVGCFLGRLSSRRDSPSSIRIPEVAIPSLKSTRASVSSSLLAQFELNELQERAQREIDKPESQQNAALLNLIINEWAVRDPLEALAFAQEHQRDNWLHECLSVFGRTDPNQAELWIDENITDLGLRNHFTGAVYRGFAEEDPKGAISRIEQRPSGPQRDQLLYAAIDQWALQDIDGAFDWIEMQGDSPFLSSAYSQVLGRYIEQSPEKASFLISEMEHSMEKINFSNRVAYQLGRRDPKEALTWAETLKGDAQHFALMGLMETWGKSTGGLQALDYAKGLPASQNNDELFTMATMKIAQAHPDALAQELPSLTENQQRIAAIQLAQSYSSNDPAKTVSWLNSLDSGSVRDAALKTSLQSFRHSNISQAFALSETIADESLRRTEMQQTLLDWLPVDPEAAFQALQNNESLPDTQKRVIIDFLSREVPTANEYLIPAR